MSKAMEIVKSLSEELDEDQILQEIISEFPDAEEEIRNSFNTEGRYGQHWGNSGSFEAEGTEYNWIESEEEAERIALDIVKNDLDQEPEIFNQDWLQGFISMTDTDKRVISSEEADNRIGDMDDEEVVKEAGLEDEYAEAEEAGDQEKMDVIIDNARDNVHQRIADEMEDALDDPIQYFVHDQGIYSIEDLMKQPWITINTDEAAQSAVDTDGWAHFLSMYDGDYQTTKGGVVFFRES